MMKVIVDTQALRAAIGPVVSIIKGRTPKPILQCLLIEVDKHAMYISGTDLECAVRLKIDAAADSQKVGKVAVPAQRLAQIVNSCASSPTLTIQCDDQFCANILGRGVKFDLFGYDPKDMPVMFAEPSLWQIELSAGELLRLVDHTLFAVANECSRYALNGIMMMRDKKKLQFAATDGRQLAIDAAPANWEADWPKKGAVVPARSFAPLRKVLDDPEESVRIGLLDDNNRMVFQVGDSATVITQLIDEAFPPYMDVIPPVSQHKFRVDCKVFAEALRQAALLTSEESKGVRFTFANNGSKSLTLSSRTPKCGSAEVVCDLESIDGQPCEIGFQPKYLAGALATIDGILTMEINRPNQAAVIRRDDFVFVVAPMNLA